jgi:hypothetical protein
MGAAQHPAETNTFLTNHAQKESEFCMAEHTLLAAGLDGQSEHNEAAVWTC